MCKLPTVAATDVPKGNENLVYRPTRSLIVVDEDHEVTALRQALEVTQAKLRKAEQELEAQQLECEQLHFRLQAVSFGSHSFADVDQEWECEQRDNPWTRQRVQHAVETRNVTNLSGGGTELRISLNLRKPLATVIPSKRSSRKKGNGSVVPPCATNAKRHVQSALKPASCRAGSQPKKRNGKVTFADDVAIFSRCPVCVDDYEHDEELVPNSNINDESKQNDDEDCDDFAIDIVDRWTSTLVHSRSRVFFKVLKQKKQDEETKQSDNVNDWIREQVPSLREMITNKKIVGKTSVASAARTPFNGSEFLEC